MNQTSSLSFYRWLFIFTIVCVFNFITADNAFSGDDINIIESKKHYEKGVNFLNNNNIVAAIQEIEKSISLYPDNQFAHFKLGYIYLEKTKAKYYYKAPEHFRKVIEIVKDPSDSYYIDSYYNMGISYLQLGQYDEAITAFKEVLALDSNYTETIKIHNYLGVAYYYKDNYEMAIPEFKTALQMDAHFKLSNFNLKSVNMRLEHYNIGITYFFMKNFEEAIKEFSIAIEIDTNYFAAHMMIGETYLKKGIYTEAIREFQRAMMINPTHRDIPKILNKLGIVYYLQEKYKESVAALRKALELDPDNDESKTNLRNVYQNYRIPDIDKEKQRDKYVQTHFDLAEDYFSIEMYPEALKEYQIVFELDSQNEVVYKRLKETYQKTITYYFENKKYDEVISILKKMIQIEPENENYWFMLGKAYYHKGKVWAKESIEALSKAPTIKESYYFKGKSLMDKGLKKDAITAFEIAAEKDSQNPDIPNELGNVYYGLSDYENALDWYKKASEIDPKNQEYIKNINKANNQLTVREKSKINDEESELKEETTPQYLNKEAIKYAKDGSIDASMEIIERAIKIRPDSGILYNTLGNLSFIKGVLDDALTNYIMADNLTPNTSEILLNLAIAYYKLKDYDSAEKTYQKAIKINKMFTDKYKWLLNKENNDDNPRNYLLWLELR